MDNTVSLAKVSLLIFLTSTAVIASFLSIGYYPGHDVGIHMSFWFEMARQWHEGVVYPRWAGASLFGYGDPGLLFYPPLSKILGGALVALFPPRWALGTYAWIVLSLGGFSFFHLCHEFFDDRSSLVAAFTYIINPYNLIVLYFRCALGEFLAAALFPLFILALYRLGKKGKQGVAALALMIGLFWLTNIPASVIVNYAAAMLVVVLALARRSKSILVHFLLSEVLGAGVAACYLLPAWHQQPWIDTSGIFGIDPLHNFLLGGRWYRDPSHFWVLLNASFLWQVFVGGLACFAAWKFCPQRRDMLTALATISAGGALLCLPVSGIVWKYGPFLSYVQFPWRCLFFISLAVAFFIGAALSQAPKLSGLAAATCAYSLVILLAWSTVRYRTLDWNEFAAPFRSGAGFAASKDYVPRAVGDFKVSAPAPAWMPSPRLVILNSAATDREASSPRQTPSKPATFDVQSWQAESRIFTVDSPQPARVRVRLFYFPGWHVFVNGSEVRNLERDAHDVLVIPLPPGHSRVLLEFQSTPDEIAGIVISCLAAMVISALYLVKPIIPA